jgi:hypothetical protein
MIENLKQKSTGLSTISAAEVQSEGMQLVPASRIALSTFVQMLCAILAFSEKQTSLKFFGECSSPTSSFAYGKLWISSIQPSKLNNTCFY